MSGAIGGGEPPRAANIRALEFWKDYTQPEAGGDPKEYHWVKWARVGDLHYHQQNECVQRLMKPRRDRQSGMEEYDPIWLAIKPAYEAWLAGTSVPLTGTPLDAWSALTKKQVRAFRDAGYHTIEDVAEITDGDLPRVRIPDVRKIRDLARAFENHKKGSAVIEEALAKRDEALAAREAEIKELRDMVTQMNEALKAATVSPAKADAA
jgi:hypothetical protein